jgi:radical SAM superfamily enzyme YgiQ (UPF0313 family)
VIRIDRERKRARGAYRAQRREDSPRLIVGGNGLTARPRRLAADIQQIGPFDFEAAGEGDGGVDIFRNAVAAERIWGDVNDGADVRPLAPREASSANVERSMLVVAPNWPSRTWRRGFSR